MKKIIAVMVAMFLLTVAFASAETMVGVEMKNFGGEVMFNQYTEVKGNYWPWPEAPQPKTPTASIDYSLMNDGCAKFESMAYTPGTGLQWPDVNDGEWGMAWSSELKAVGETQTMTDIDVWTVHEGWSTNYMGGQMDKTMTMTDEEMFGGTTGGAFGFDKMVMTDEKLKQEIELVINPWSK